MVRSCVVLVAALAIVLAPALPAHAADVRVANPRQDATLGAGSHRLEVVIAYDLLEAPTDRVDARLTLADARTDPAALRCVAGCGTPEETWRASFRPGTGAPFRDGPLPNGDARIEVAVGGASYRNGPTITLSAPPSPPTAVQASADGQDVAVRWSRVPEPDIVAYRVERRTDDGSWREAGRTGGEADRFVDRDRAAGTYDYRIVSIRPDGAGGSHAAASEPTRARVSAMRRSPDGDAGSPDGSAGPPDPAAAGDDAAGRRGDEAGDAGADDAAGDAGASGSSGGRASAPTLGSSSAPRPRGPLDAPPVPDVAASGPEFYGEDEAFSERLDFGDARPVAGETVGAGDETELVRVPGGMATSLQRVLDPQRLLMPAAGGLLLIAVGLHLRQWLTRGRDYLRAR